MKRHLFVFAQVIACSLILAAGASAQANTSCVNFTVIQQDKLKNVKEGLSADDAKWFREKIEKKYPGACYVDPAPTASTVFYITITPDTYNGTRIVNQTSTQATPVHGTITDQDGNVSYVNGTEQTTSTSSTAVPYSFEYGIFTLSVESRRSDGTFEIVQTFQQKGIYNTLYGIPLGGRGHHPAHAVIEDAAKWVNGGGLTDQRQSSLQPPQPQPNAIADAGTTLQARAQAGDVRAQYAFAATYEHGDGAPQDYSQAVRWYRKAAEQGDADAQNALGVLYRDGKGLPQDYVQAASWLRKAAEQGNVLAQNSLACLFHDGQGVPQDFTQAALWFRKAADQGNAIAQTNLGVLFDKGMGMTQDEEQAAVWFRRAGEQGNGQAQFSLGVLYYNGQGLPQSYLEAYYWLSLTAAHGTKEALLEDAIKYRDQAASHLTPADLSQAQARASKWFAEHTVSK